MSETKLHPIARAFLSRIGTKGGKAKTAVKAKSSAQNAAKAREVKQQAASKL